MAAQNWKKPGMSISGAGGAARVRPDRVESLAPAHARSEDPRSRSIASEGGRRGDPRPSVVIIGSYNGSTFVAAEVLICTDTLGAEKAIRAWLEAHDIRLAG
jgi:hypothetical protein